MTTVSCALYTAQTQLVAGGYIRDSEQFVSRGVSFGREADVAPAAELVDDLMRRDAGGRDGAANRERRAERRAEDIRGQTLRVHGIFRASDHLIQSGRAVAAGHMNGVVSQGGAHQLQALG